MLGFLQQFSDFYNNAQLFTTIDNEKRRHHHHLFAISINILTEKQIELMEVMSPRETTRLLGKGVSH